MSACPDKILLLNALIDGELDAANTVALEAHVAGCPGCAAELEALRTVKARLGLAGLREPAPAGLRLRIAKSIEREKPATAIPPRRRRGVSSTWVMSGSGAALAASLALFALFPAGPALETQLVDGHIRSLQAAHLVDIPTSDRHVVKPWFNGKIDFAPPVIELADQGFPLVGGRLDRVNGRSAAALVYRRRAHVINVFVWPGAAPTAPVTERRQGYALIRWGQGGLTFWAVSDIDPADLETFQKAFAARVPA